jgi:nucleoside-diphosphate-sugar epimerase
MVGSGQNKKSMAYIGNVVAFLDKCIETDKAYALFNYVDTPDYSMNDLIKHVRLKLTGKNNVGLRIPFWLGFFLGYIADIVSKVRGKPFPISAIRVKKFVSSTEFRSAKSGLDHFEAPYSLEEGIERMLVSEFINPNPEREIFYTE